MLESERVADFVHRHQEPSATVLALAPIQRSVHDRLAGPTDPCHALRWIGGVAHTDIARGDRETLVGGFHESDARVAAEELKNLTGPLLLRFGDGVLLRHAVEGAVVVLEVVILNHRRRASPQGNLRVAVPTAVGGNVTMAWGIDGAVLSRESEIPGRRGQRRPRRDRSGNDYASRTDGPEVACSREARIVVTVLGHRARHDRDAGGAADLEAVELAVSDQIRFGV